MMASQLRSQIIAERAAWIREMLRRMQQLPLTSFDLFTADPRNTAAADSYLRRALEALLDLGRHVLARGFGQAVTEYRDIARGLVQVGVLDPDRGTLLRELAGYRNRLVHFYHEVSDEELYEICSQQTADIEMLLATMLDWVKAHPELINQAD